MYDPADRRLTSMDPVLNPVEYDLRQYVTHPVQFVQYQYVTNNPLIYVDPLGLMLDRGGGPSGPAVLASQGSSKNDPNLVMEIQRKLKSLGYYYDAVDGSFGPNTKAAVKQFQDDHKSSLQRSATGILDEKTLGLIRRTQTAKYYEQRAEIQRQKEEAMYPSAVPTPVTSAEPAEKSWLEKFVADAKAYGNQMVATSNYWLDEASYGGDPFSITYAYMNYFTCGSIDGALETNRRNWEIMKENPNAYTVINYAFAGIPETIGKAALPAVYDIEPWSFEHLMNMVATIFMGYSAKSVYQQVNPSIQSSAGLEKYSWSQENIVQSQVAMQRYISVPDDPNVWVRLDTYEDIMKYGTSLGKDGQLFLTRADALAGLDLTNPNDLVRAEHILGLPSGRLSSNTGIIVTQVDIRGLNPRLPTQGNEFFIPGGATSGGAAELVIDPIDVFTNPNVVDIRLYPTE